MAARSRALVGIIVIALVVALFASYFLYSYLRGQERRVDRAVVTGRVLVANMKIPVGSVVGNGQVRSVAWPKNTIPAGSMNTSAEAVGRVALVTIEAGDPVTQTKLMPKEGGMGILSYKIPEGHRAMTVAVDRVSGVAGFITPGNKVDVITTTARPGGKERISKIILQDVPILATGKILEQKPSGEAVEVPTVTMDLLPEDAEKLALAGSEGHLQLLLRKVGDTEDVFTSGATIAKVLKGDSAKTRRVVKRRKGKGKRRAVVSKPRYVKASVEVLRNGNKRVETFKVKTAPAGK